MPMYRTLGLGSLVLGLVCLVPGEADAQKKKKKGEEVPPATAADYAQLSQLKEVVGQLVAASVNVNPNSLPYKIVAESKDFELPVDEKVIVRRQTLPYTYDDKGNPVQYSKEDIEKLRGTDKSKPGYQAKYEDLTSGQI